MFTTNKQSTQPSASCSSSPSSPSTTSHSRRAPFIDITNQLLLASSPPSLQHGIPSSSPGFSLPRTPGGGEGGGMNSSPVRGEFLSFDEDDELDDEDEEERRGGLVAGPSSGSGRKKAKMSEVKVKDQMEREWEERMEGVESESSSMSSGREEGKGELENERRGFRMPAGSNRYGGGAGGQVGRSMGAMEFLSSRGMGMQGGRRRRLMGAQGLASNVSTLDYYPSSIVTSHSDDLYRMPSFLRNDFAPVFVCQFSNAAKNGGRQTMALGSEEGGLEFVDAGKNTQWDREHTRKSHRPHENAIFDLKWSPDDSQIVTSSGAQVSLVIDVETQQTLATLKGHTSSVKTTIWDPSNPNILASAARDGHINVYDLRAGWKSCEAEQPKKRARGPGSSSRSAGGERLPVNTVRHAHGEPGQKKAPAASARTATRSPTSILYIPQRAHTIASCGTGDGVIKLWDLRTHGSYTTRKGYPAPAAEESHDPTFSASSSTNSFGSSSALMKRGRPHGIANMCLSKDGDLIYALGTDNKVHLHSPLSLSTPSLSPDKYYTHPSLRVTFYSRLSISPCGRYLVSGSARGRVHLWEVGGSWAGTGGCGKREREGIVLKADDGGREIGCVDWGGEGFASVSDDLHMRVWKSNEVAAAWLKEDRSAAEWSWGGRSYEE